MPKRGYHHGNLKEALIEAALVLIREKGPTGFTLSEAAKRAGVTPAAVYRHFIGREDLIAEAPLQGYHIFADLMEHAYRDGQPSALAAIEATGRADLAFARVHPGHYIACLKVVFPLIAQQNSRMTRNTRAGLWTALQKSFATTCLRIAAPRIHVQRPYLAMSHGVVELFARNSAGAQSPFAPEDLLETGIGVYLRGLGVLPADG